MKQAIKPGFGVAHRYVLVSNTWRLELLLTSVWLFKHINEHHVLQDVFINNITKTHHFWRKQLRVVWYSTTTYYWTVPLILDHSFLVGRLTCSKIADYESVILEVLKLLFQQFLNLPSFQRDMSGPILGDLSNNTWSGVQLINHEGRKKDHEMKLCWFKNV